jgi:hypothetical protein
VRRLLLLAVLLAAPAAIRAQPEDDLHGDSAAGVRGVFFRPKDADHGVKAPGIFGRLKMERGSLLELSVDHARHTSAGSSIRTIPIQLSMIAFAKPDETMSPYLLLGYGWYHRKHSNHSELSQFPHAGLGLQFADKSWLIDAGYRLMWTAVWRLNDYARPWGRAFQNKGSMLTLSLGRKF